MGTASAALGERGVLRGGQEEGERLRYRKAAARGGGGWMVGSGEGKDGCVSGRRWRRREVREEGKGGRERGEK